MLLGLLKILLLPLLAISCKTTEIKEPVKSISKGNDNQTLHLLDSKCSNINLSCQEQIPYSPTMCFVRSYDNTILPQSEIIQGWGNNNCKAKLALLQTACSQNKKLDKLASILCIPDPSEGECPPKDIKCPAKNDRTVCTAYAYNSTHLSFKDTPRSWGDNECIANQELIKTACKLNLIPSLMQDIECEPDYTNNECPIQPEVCPDDKIDTPHWCKIYKIGDTELDKPITAYGNSECEAKNTIYDLICLFSNKENRIKPSEISNITCYSE